MLEYWAVVQKILGNLRRSDYSVRSNFRKWKHELSPLDTVQVSENRHPRQILLRCPSGKNSKSDGATIYCQRDGFAWCFHGLLERLLKGSTWDDQRVLRTRLQTSIFTLGRGQIRSQQHFFVDGSCLTLHQAPGSLSGSEAKGGRPQHVQAMGYRLAAWSLQSRLWFPE